MAVNTTKMALPDLDIELFECDFRNLGKRFNWRIVESGKTVSAGSGHYTSKTRANTEAKVELNKLLGDRFKQTIESFAEDNEEWIERWNDTIAASPELPGVWRRKDGGYRIRGRANDPSGKQKEINRALPECRSASEAAALLKIEIVSIKGTEPSGAPIRLRVTAIYANGAERELREFPVTEDGLTGFETDDSEYIAFVARVEKTTTAVESVINAHVEGAPF